MPIQQLYFELTLRRHPVFGSYDAQTHTILILFTYNRPPMSFCDSYFNWNYGQNSYTPSWLESSVRPQGRHILDDGPIYIAGTALNKIRDSRCWFTPWSARKEPRWKRTSIYLPFYFVFDPYAIYFNWSWIQLWICVVVKSLVARFSCSNACFGAEGRIKLVVGLLFRLRKYFFM